MSVGFDGGSIGAFLASRACPLDFRCLACEAEASQARATKPTLLVETPPDSSPALSYYEEQRGVRAPISEISEALLGGVHIGSSPLGQGRTEFKRIRIIPINLLKLFLCMLKEATNLFILNDQPIKSSNKYFE